MGENVSHILSLTNFIRLIVIDFRIICEIGTIKCFKGFNNILRLYDIRSFKAFNQLYVIRSFDILTKGDGG